MDILTGRAGTFYVNTATEAVVNTVMIVVGASGAQFDHIKINGVDVKATYLQDAGVSVEGGTVICPLDITKPFEKIKLVSGSVTLVRK